MSLILDALNRSQNERDNSREVPGIDTQHWVEPLPRSGGWQRRLPWLGLGIALAVIAWLLFAGGENKVEPVSGESSVRAVHTPDPLPQKQRALPSSLGSRAATASSSVSEPAGARGSAVPSAVADLYKRKEPTKSPQYTEVAKPTQSATVSVPKSQPGSQSQTRSTHSEDTIDIEKMIARVRGQAENLELPEHSAPFLGDLSQQMKDQIPTIYYTQHDYSSVDGQSSVILNGELVRVGGKVAGRLKLVEILPKSIVLSDKGQAFRLNALNSWINL